MDELLTYTTLNDIYLNKCNKEREEIGYVNDIYAIGDLHGDYKILIKILLKYDIIIITEEYKYKEYTFEYKLNDKLSSYALIQIGDQLDGNRHLDYTINNFKDEDNKIVYFFDNLREQSKKLKDVYIISIIGNHEFMNLKKIYKYVSPYNLENRNQFIEDNKQNIICNRYYCVVINGFVFTHCGIVKSLIINLDLMYPKLNLINNLNNLKSLDEKIDYLDKLIRILFLTKLNNSKNEDMESILYKFVGSRYIGKDNSKENYILTCKEINDINNFFGIKNMIIGHTMQYNGIKQFKCNNSNIINNDINLNNKDNKNNNLNLFMIDTGLSGSFQQNTLKQNIHIHFNNPNDLNDYSINFDNI